jgi:trigger factor
MEAEGGSIELYAQMVGSSVDAIKKQFWIDAKHSTKITYMLDKIIQEKGFEVSDEELNQGIQAFAINAGMEIENATKKNLGPMVDSIAYEIKTEKAIQYLEEHAIVTVTEASAEENQQEKSSKLN